ncbi:hypothetical protein T492DRAFT_1092638 [Pavlovales sp. CCMP2436]|nr:hypothetical protein T492DRAFT_1092638 [Pavlovales sp. CCMP2436]
MVTLEEPVGAPGAPGITQKANLMTGETSTSVVSMIVQPQAFMVRIGKGETDVVAWRGSSGPECKAPPSATLTQVAEAVRQFAQTEQDNMYAGVGGTSKASVGGLVSTLRTQSVKSTITVQSAAFEGGALAIDDRQIGDVFKQKETVDITFNIMNRMEVTATKKQPMPSLLLCCEVQ